MILRRIYQDKPYQRALFLLLISNILVFFLGDIVNRIASSFDFGFLRFTGISKGIGLLLNLGFILKYRLYKKDYAKPLIYCIAIMIAVFLLSNLFLKNINLIENLKANLIFLLYACFLPFLLIPFFSINEETTKTGIKLLLVIFWLNLIFIFVGFVFDIQEFRTYFYGERFGFKGLFERSTYVSYMFIFVLIYYYYNWQIYKSKKELLSFILVAIFALLVGTKRIYLSMILLAAFHVFYAKLYKKRIFYFGLIGLSVFLFLFKSSVYKIFAERFDLLIDIYKNEGFLTALSSYRSDLLVGYVHNLIEHNWSILNYVFGGGIFHLITPEMDIIDSYLFFGIFGPLIYIFIYRTYLFNYKIKNPIIKFYIILIIILAMFSSGIIFSADFAIPIILFSSYFYFEHKKAYQIE